MEEAEPAVSMVGSGEPLPGQEEEGEPQSSGQQEGSNDIYLEMEPAAPPARSSRLPERGGRGEPGQRRRRRWRKGREVLAREEHQEIGEQPAGVDLGEPPQDSPGPDPPGPEQQQEEPQAPPPLKRHVYCTVYCVENDSPGEQPPREPQDEPPPFFPSLSGTNPHYSPGLEPGGGWLVLACCRVCLEDKQLKPLACCRKPVCEECLKRYLGSQVQLGQAEIKCPITECTELLEETTILYNLPHDDIIKYKYFLELSRMDSTTKPCPQCKHFTTLKRKGHIPTPSKVENKFKIQCPTCQFVWCFKCHSPWHEGVNCKEYKKGDKLLRHWANEMEHGQRNAQKCPRCKIHIQRTEGCDHMTCSQCNTNFCYRCGERYRQLRFFGDHTSNLSIFGCKYRYLPERPNIRRLVRGSVCAGKLLIAPLLLILGLALGAIAVVVGLFVFPIYCLCKKQRKRTRTGMPW